jgi:hypothetical protein
LCERLAHFISHQFRELDLRRRNVSAAFFISELRSPNVSRATTATPCALGRGGADGFGRHFVIRPDRLAG